MFSDQSLLFEFKENLDKIVRYTKEHIAVIRTSKASPSLVENLMVNAYGGQAKLKLLELSSITTDGPSGLLISPFDPTTTKEIEKAILTSPLHLAPRVDGKNIYIKIPPLSEEQRVQFLKIVSQEVENAREHIRVTRDDSRKKIKTALENKDLSEDQKFRIDKEIDKITQEFNLQIQQIKEKKDKEIMEI